MERESANFGVPRIRLVGTPPDPDGHPRGTAVAASVTALTSAALGGSAALAAPGDLDPAFGDLGRSFDFSRPTLWSLDVNDAGDVAFGGGEEYCSWYYTSCVDMPVFGRLLPGGTPDAAFAAATLQNAFIFDTVLQPDGKLVAIGRQDIEDQVRLIVLRLLPDGSLDSTFATGGRFLMPDSSIENETGRSVLLEDDGRLVIAGDRGGGIVVARLLPNGTLDPTFGSAGIAVVGQGRRSVQALEPAAGAGYRVLANVAENPELDARPACHVFALDGSGAPEAAFGGASQLKTPGATHQRCSDFDVSSDGRMVVGGSGGYLIRLLADGSPDPAFATDTVESLLGTIDAVTVAPSGKVFAGGMDASGLAGATIVRLLADGTLDTLFGDGGHVRIELPTARAVALTARDLEALPGDALLVAGGYYQNGFVARLLGDGPGDGPGVVGMTDASVLVSEQEGQATLHVRRFGGSQGAVSVTYTARSPDGWSATAGADYTAVTGTLDWADGEAGEREIVVPILADDLGEGPESFEVVLESTGGGAGLGVLGSDVNIAGQTFPHGAFTFSSAGGVVREGNATQLWVSRQDYCQGAVSVTVHLAGGDAQAGQDFNVGAAWTDMTLHWDDGDCSVRSIEILAERDKKNEDTETLMLQLTSPTGGAQIGSQPQATLTIQNTAAPDNGGGAFGGLGAGLLGLLAGLRRRRSPAPAS